jgi:hypothetical protein
VKAGNRYFCEQCGADLTKFVRRRNPEASPLIGKDTGVCRCGREYLTGLIEWDHLTTEQKRKIYKRLALGSGVLLSMFVFAGAVGKGVHGNQISIAHAVDGCIEGVFLGSGLVILLLARFYHNVLSSFRRTRRPGGD